MHHPPGAKTINVFRACLGAQLTICAQKWRNFVLFSTVSLRFVLSRVCVFLYSLGPLSSVFLSQLATYPLPASYKHVSVVILQHFHGQITSTVFLFVNRQPRSSIWDHIRCTPRSHVTKLMVFSLFPRWHRTVCIVVEELGGGIDYDTC